MGRSQDDATEEKPVEAPRLPDEGDVLRFSSGESMTVVDIGPRTFELRPDDLDIDTAALRERMRIEMDHFEVGRMIRDGEITVERR